MKRYEKFILIYIGAVILSRIIIFVLDAYFTRSEISDSEALDYPVLHVMRTILPSISNLVIAVWLYLETSRRVGGRCMWAAFGLMTGLLGVCVFYVLQIWENLRNSEESPDS